MTLNAGLAIETNGLVKRFGSNVAVDGVDLAVPSGGVYGVLGPNGAGKTTTIRMQATLLEIDGGSARVLGHDVAKEADTVRSKVALTGQFASLDEDLSGTENLVLLARLFGFSRSAAKARSEQLLTAFDLVEAGPRQVKTFSGGMRRRLDIAASIIVTPELIFLDEPTAALDPQARRALWKVLRDLKNDGTTVVYTTHHLEEAEALCDRVAIIVDGAFVAVETPETLAQAAAGPTRLLVPAGRMTIEQAMAIPGVDHAEREGESIVLHTEVAGQVLVGVDAIAGLRGVRTKTSTLEDIYLELTGMEP